MSDLIDRRDLLDALEELEEEWEDACLRPDYYDAKRAIKNAKAVQIPEKVCEWERDYKFISDKYKVETGCGYTFYDLHHAEPFKKCPYCGGKLKIKGGE